MSTVIATIPVGRDPAAIAIGAWGAAMSIKGDRVTPAYAHAFVTNSKDRTVSVIDIATNSVVATIPVVGGPPGDIALGSIAISSDGAHAYVTNTYLSGSTLADGTVSVIDIAAKTVVATIGVGSVISAMGVAVSPDGARVYVTNFGEGTVSIIDTATNTVTAAIPVGLGVYGVAVSPDGAHVYLTNFEDGTVSVIDTATNIVTATVGVGVGAVSGGGRGPGGVAVSPDGSRVYVTNLGDDTVSVIDTATNTVTATITVGRASSWVAVSPDGARVYVTNADDDTVSVIDTATYAVTDTLAVARAGGVAVSPDGTRVYVTNYSYPAGGNGSVSVIDVADGFIDNSRSAQLIADLIGAVDRDGGGWLVIGNHVIPVPPRSPFLAVIADAAAPYLDQAIANRELADQIKELLQARPR